MPIENNEHGAMIEEMKNQLLIVWVKRNGGKLEVPASEIDDTGQDLLSMRVDPDTMVFHFETSKKT